MLLHPGNNFITWNSASIDLVDALWATGNQVVAVYAPSANGQAFVGFLPNTQYPILVRLETSSAYLIVAKAGLDLPEADPATAPVYRTTVLTSTDTGYFETSATFQPAP